MAVTKEEITRGLLDLGLEGKPVVVHSSLSAFGPVQGGAHTVVAALCGVCGTVLMPAYSSLGRTRAPARDRPQQNGTDYQDSDYATTLLAHDIVPFDPDAFGPASQIDPDMGVISETLLQAPGTVRSKHPSVSWAAKGDQAASFVETHPAEDPMLPLKRLMHADGAILLLGVGLSRCTALHLAEEVAGRRPFIRWVLYADRMVRRIREYGCSDGFIHLGPDVAPLARRRMIGICEAVVYPMGDLVRTSSQLMRQCPERTFCSNGKGCERCRDAAKGGPIEE